jgi:uncharacterized protein GlcG (DUF336 family)
MSVHSNRKAAGRRMGAFQDKAWVRWRRKTDGGVPVMAQGERAGGVGVGTRSLQ